MKPQSALNRGVTIFVSIFVIGLAGWLYWMPSRQNSTPLSQLDSQPLPTKKPALYPQLADAKNGNLLAPSQLKAEKSGGGTLVVQESPPGPQPPQSSIIQGYGESARLVDKAGNTLLQATATAPIYSAKPSPSGELIIISRGGGVHQIYRLSPFSIMRDLPITPDIPRACAFETWQWIDDNTLLGVSALEKVQEELEKMTAAETESQWREKTLLYFWNLKNETLKRITDTVSVIPPSFSVIETRPGGYLMVEWDEHEASKKVWIKVSKE